LLLKEAGRSFVASFHGTKGRAMTDSRFNPANVIAVSFADDSKAYDALTDLKELATQEQISLEGAAVVARTAEGKLVQKDLLSDGYWENMAGGGIIGLLVGVLAGPLGVLIGGATGVLVGSLFDMDDADDTDSVLAEIAKSVKPGHTSLLAEVVEQSPEVVDTAMARLQGTVLRRPLDEVEAEVAAAQKAQREAKKKARKELREARHEHNKEKVSEQIAHLKAKLPHHEKAKA
jgi:uncharacterized membrane protein